MAYEEYNALEILNDNPHGKAVYPHVRPCPRQCARALIQLLD